MSEPRGGGSWGDPPESDDQLDDLEFEEFQLSEPEDWGDGHEHPQYDSPETYLTCPSCGVPQPTSNRHCQQCGARLGQQRMAVAAPPLRSVSAGNRAMKMIVGGVAGVVVVALVLQAIRGDDTPENGEASGNPTTSVVSETTVPFGPLEEITPISITCSSEYNSNLGCGNLIDSKETYWNDESLRGEDARITVTFVNPVALEQVQIVNVDNMEKFRRNYRVRGVEIYADDLPGVPFVDEIPDANDRPHGVSTATNHTEVLEIRVTSAWPSEALGGEQAFDELAVQEIKFWGRVQNNSRELGSSSAG